MKVSIPPHSTINSIMILTLAAERTFTPSPASATGGSTGTQLYKAWGETRGTGLVGTKYQFQGQFAYNGAGEIGLHYFRARFFDPQLGRFATADSIIPGAGNPLAWDRYAGMANNAVRNVDPSGHFCIGSGTNCTGDDATDWGMPAAMSYSSTEITLTFWGSRINKLFDLFKSTENSWWKALIDGGLDPLLLFMAVILSRESLPLWRNSNYSDWGKGGEEDPKHLFGKASNHWLWGWVKDNYGEEFGNLSPKAKKNVVLNWLGNMESARRISYTSRGKRWNKDTQQEEDHPEYIKLSSDERLKKDLNPQAESFNQELYTIAIYTMINPTSERWAWGNYKVGQGPDEYLYRYDSFYIIEGY